ncbi:MAG: magnesium transporter [Dehalococcoidia bacterium]
MADEDVVQGLVDDARTLISDGEWAKAVALVTSLHPADLVDLVLALDDRDRQELIRHLPTDITGQLFEYVEDDEIRGLIEAVGLGELPAVLEETPDDVAADVIQQLEPGERAEALAALDREEVTDLMQYEDESAGGIMTTGFVQLNQQLTVAQALDYLRQLRPSSDKAYYLYITDQERRLQGVVSIRDLVVAPPQTRLAEITQHDVHAVSTSTDQEEVARLLQRYNLLAVPVVDEEGRLEGVTTADDLIDVLQEEATEDMYRMVGLDEEETRLTPLRQTIRLRLPWLVVNLATAFVSTIVLLVFQGTVERAAVLLAFVPAIANQAGVTGTQTATITVRSIALGEARSPLARALSREWAVGMINGLTVGLLLATVALVFERNLTLSIILLVAMASASAAAGPIGQTVPLVLRLLRADPALSSSIFVTMFTDGISYFLALSLATLLITQLE